MKSRLLILGFILGAIVVVTGCAQQVTDWKDAFKVTPGKVVEYKKVPETKVDVFVPLKDQFASSKHASALETLNKNDHKQDYCYNCHSAEYRLAPDNAKPDVKQLSTSITCMVCHDLTIGDFRLKTAPMETCTNCHTAGAINAGAAVNHPQKEMFSGTGALEVADKPSTKYNAGLTCIECHMPNQSHTFKALTPAESLRQKVGSTCMMCHTKLTQQEFADKVTEIQTKTAATTDKLLKELEGIKQTIDAGGDKDMTSVKNLYDIAFTNVSFVQADGSKGVHNTEYAWNILDVAEKKIAEAKNLISK